MKIIIHGGFFSESATNHATKIQKQVALKEIVTKGFNFMYDHTALETVIYTVGLLEDNPLFNAGTGSQIQSDGSIRMSAAIADGQNLNFAGVMNIQKVKNPISVAEQLLPLQDKVLCDSGATLFARRKGFEFYDPETVERKKEYQEKIKNKPTSTVGCVCFDVNGQIAAATSTGGKGFETVGRISDSATVAGTYANSFCGVSITGVGEDIVRVALASKIVTRVTDGMPIEEAFKKSFKELSSIDGFAGAISIDYLGNIFHYESHPTMTFSSFDGQHYTIFS